MHHDYREAWLSNLGQRTGLTTLAFDQAGVCQLILDRDLVLTLHNPDTSDKLVIFGQLPTPALPLDFAREMLKRNRSHARLSSPVISLSPEEDAIEVHLVLDAAYDLALELIGGEIEVVALPLLRAPGRIGRAHV